MRPFGMFFGLLWCGVGVCGEGGSIAGTVADPAGGLVAGAVVVARQVETCVEQKATTNERGFYALTALAGGHYELHLKQEGFEPFRRAGIDLTAGASLRVDIGLALGARSETMQVTESGAQVETASTQMGEPLRSRELAGIPVNGRSFTDLLALQPGVTQASSQQPNAVVMSGCTNAPPSGDLNPGNLSVSGQRETANGFSVNGSAAQEDFNMGTAIVPNLDAIDEVRVLTSNFDAEYGNYSGAQVLVTTKSGTNELHGSAFDFLRTAKLDARNFFAVDRASYERSQSGGTLGGPVRHDRTFFFADFQATRMTEGIDTGLTKVPSAANRLGDLRDAADLLTGTVNGTFWADRLTKKLGYGVRAGEPYYFNGCENPEACVLPGARIPERAWAKPARTLLPFIPMANQAGNVFSTSAENETLRDYKGAFRVDHHTRWGTMTGYYFADGYTLDNPYPTAQGGANVPGFNATSEGRAQLATVGLTTTLGPRSVNELRLGYMRTANRIGRPVGGVGPTLVQQGFADASGKPGIVPLAPAIEGIANVSFNDFTLGVDITGADQANNTVQIADNFTRVAGKHIMKFGVGMHRDQVNIGPNAMYNGSFLFQGTETGSDFADFLLGIASSYAQGDSNHFYLRNQYVGVYGQDSWQVRRGLTVNYGIRWDRLPPWREKYNQLQTLVPGQQSVVYPGAPAGLVFPGDAGVADSLTPARYGDFAPRAGVAYATPNGKTSVRAGFGMFYTAIEGLSAGIMSACPPYGYDYNSFAPPLFETPFVTAATGQDAGQRFPSPIPARGATSQNPNSAVDWSMYLPVTGVPSFSNKNVTPYSESYTLAVERQLGPQTMLRAGYAGTQAHHLLVLESANPGNAARCLELSGPNNVAPGTATCGPFGESGTYTTRDGRTVAGTRGPFGPQFAAVTLQKTIANSNYNALEVMLRHSGQGAEVMLGYTFSKSLDQSSSLAEAVNPVNPNLSKALSAFDIRHNVVASYRADLPVARVLGRRSRWTDGWSLSGVVRLSTGMPVTLVNNNDSSLLGTIPNGINNQGVDTPNYVPGDLRVNRDPRNGQPAFNTAQFSLPELGTIGTAARRFFSGPGMVNMDAALRKSVRLGETRGVELRLEAFNVMNHAQFFGAASVNGNITSGSFGQIVSANPARKVQAAVKFTF